jgi:hypothetical protein
MDARQDVAGQRTKVGAQLLFDRSRDSAFNLLKLLVALSTAGVAGYFATLTRISDPKLTESERNVALVALSCMVASVFAGLIGWGFDARFYERWAQHEQKEETPGRLWRAREWAGDVRRYSIVASTVFFVVGVVISGVFAYIRSKQVI